MPQYFLDIGKTERMTAPKNFLLVKRQNLRSPGEGQSIVKILWTVMRLEIDLPSGKDSPKLPRRDTGLFQHLLRKGFSSSLLYRIQREMWISTCVSQHNWPQRKVEYQCMFVLSLNHSSWKSFPIYCLIIGSEPRKSYQIISFNQNSSMAPCNLRNLM